MKANPNYT